MLTRRRAGFLVSLASADALLLLWCCAETVCQKVTDSLRLLWAVIGGFIDYLTGVMHDISREYRSVSRILDREKEAEKKRMRRVSTAVLSTDMQRVVIGPLLVVLSTGVLALQKSLPLTNQ